VRFANAISIAVVVAATATVVAQARPASERGESGERPRPPSAADDDERAFRPATFAPPSPPGATRIRERPPG
jgi:hypothetical protein